MASPISVQSSLAFGWKTFKARPWLFVGTIIIYAAVQFVLALIEGILPEFISFFVSLAAGTLLAVGFMSLYLKAHDNLSAASFKDLWNPKPFWQYLVTSVIMAVIVILGLLALIVPGIILALALSMAPYIVIEKRVWTMTALKESWRMTKGSWLKLLLLGVVITLMNFVGMLLLMIGLLVTAPISMLAMVHVYRTLSGTSVSEAAPMLETAPVATPHVA
jgi:uncharacterized membrane protein